MITLATLVASGLLVVAGPLLRTAAAIRAWIARRRGDEGSA